MIARGLLLLFPLVVLLFPQGTVTRSGASEALVAGFLALAVLMALLERGFGVTRPRQLMSLTHLPLLALLAYLLVVNPYLSWLRGNDPTMILVTTVPFVMLGAYYLFVLAGFDERHVGVFLDMTLLGALVISGLVWWVGVSGGYLLSGGRVTMIEGGGQRALSYPVLAMGGTIAFVRGLVATSGSRRLFYGLSFLVILSAVLLGVTRAMLGALLIGCLTAFLALGIALRGRRLALLGGALSFAALGVVVFVPFLGQWQSRLSAESVEGGRSILGRVEELRVFGEGFLASPVIGQGIGHQFADPSSVDIVLATVGIALPHSHVAFVAGSTGLIGLLLYYGVVGGALLRAFRLLGRLKSRPEDFGILLALSAGFGTGVLFTLTSTTYTALSYNYYLAFALFALRLPWERPAAAP